MWRTIRGRSSSGEGAAENLLRLNVQAEARELLQVPRSALRRVVGDEEEPLTRVTQHGERFRHAVDERVSPPDDSVAVEDEHVDVRDDVILSRGVKFGYGQTHTGRHCTRGGRTTRT